MMRRALWFGAGAATAVWTQRKLRRTARRFTPPHVAMATAEAARARGRDVVAAVREGRVAMREREAELRVDLTGGIPAQGGEVRELRRNA